MASRAHSSQRDARRPSAEASSAAARKRGSRISGVSSRKGSSGRPGCRRRARRACRERRRSSRRTSPAAAGGELRAVSAIMAPSMPGRPRSRGPRLRIGGGPGVDETAAGCGGDRGDERRVSGRPPAPAHGDDADRHVGDDEEQDGFGERPAGDDQQQQSSPSYLFFFPHRSIIHRPFTQPLDDRTCLKHDIVAPTSSIAEHLPRFALPETTC